MLVAGILEVFGGLLILIGFLTRPVAFVLSGFMAVAYFMAHAPQSVFPMLNMGDAAILFCFVFLYLLFAGPGAWSVDRVRSDPSARTS
jgi:putative oxidoreductase